MKKIRQHNDFTVRWSLVKKDTQEPFILEGMEVSLVLKNLFTSKELNDFTVQGNTIEWEFKGKEQTQLGVHTLTLTAVGNKMLTTDACDFVDIVDCDCKTGGDDPAGLETQTISLTSVVEFGAGGGDLSAYLTKIEAEATYQPKGDYATAAELTELSAEVEELKANSGVADIFVAEYNVTKYQEVVDAYNKHQHIICLFNGNMYSLFNLATNQDAYFTGVNRNYSYSVVCKTNNSWYYDTTELEQAFNKTTSLSSASTDTQYPSAKAVYDALQNVGGGGASTKRFALLYETTIETETDRLDLITLVPNILDNKDFVIETELTAGDGTNARNMKVNFSSQHANYNACWINGLNKATYQTHYLIKIHIGNDLNLDSSCYAECHNNSWNNEQKADGLQGLNLFTRHNVYPINTMYINFPFKVGDKIRIYGK